MVVPEQRAPAEQTSVERVAARDPEHASKIASDAIRRGAVSVSIAAGPRDTAQVTIAWDQVVTAATDVPAALAD